MYKVSVVIRTYNEAPKLRRLLEFLKNSPVEVIVVDNGSTDETPELLVDYGVIVVHLPQEEFNYPKSSNLGVAATSGDIIIMLSGHCLPLYTDWLDTVLRHFDDPKVAGMYGPVIWEKDSPWFEKITMLPFEIKLRLPGIQRITKDRLGLMGATSCAFRKTLWEEHNFDEAYGAGGEDGEWGRWALSQGYTIIQDPHFLVRHSHYLTFKKTIQQQKLWRKLRKPYAFDPADLSFRDDIKRL